MVVNFFFNIKFLFFQKVGKIHNKIVKFKVQNFEYLCRMKESRVKEVQIAHVGSIGNSIYGH